MNTALDLTGVEWAFLWLALASSQAPFDAPLDARALSRLPPSQFQIGRTLPPRQRNGAAHDAQGLGCQAGPRYPDPSNTLIQ